MFRFALSPTEDMHIGDMRVALINYILSRQKGEPFALRIEEIDKEHNLEGKDQEIKDILKKFAIEPEMIFYQSENLSRHQQFATSLLESNKAFACICRPEENKPYRCSGKCRENQQEVKSHISKEKTPYVIRINIPDSPVTFIDSIKSEITSTPEEIDSFIILQADTTPTDDFSTACDDMLIDISMIIRAEEYLSNTPSQIHIKKMIGYPKQIQYAHLPPIDSNGDQYSIKYLLEMGFLPDAIINYLLQLGNKTNEEIFTLPDAIEWFDLNNISKYPVKFDIDKLRFINKQHLLRMDDKKLSSLFDFADADIGKLIKIYLDEASTINELCSKIEPIFAPKRLVDKHASQMQTISSIIIDAPMFNQFEQFKEYIVEKSGLNGETLLDPLRILMTGASSGPELSDIYSLIKPYITQIVKIED